MVTTSEELERIRRLKYAYCRCIDMASLDELAGLFTPDASVCFVGGSYRFEAQGRDTILAALGQAFHAEAIARHQVNHPEIDQVSDSEARGVWYLRDWFMDLKHKVVTEGTALYRDRYVKRDGEWKIAYSSYERIYEIVSPLNDTPNITAHWLAQHGRKLP